MAGRAALIVRAASREPVPGANTWALLPSRTPPSRPCTLSLHSPLPSAPTSDHKKKR